MQNKIGLLLDFDGVVVDSEPLYEKAMNRVFERYSIEVVREDWLYFKGKDAAAVFKYIDETFHPSIAPKDLQKEFTAELYAIFRKEMNYIPGFVEFYKNAREVCIDSIVTSTSQSVMEWTFENTPVDYLFSNMLTSDDVKNTKPHPEPYLKGAELIGVPIERCIVIEDSLNGIRSGKASGAFVIGIASTFSKDIISKALPDIMITSYSELNNKRLLEFIEKK